MADKIKFSISISPLEEALVDNPPGPTVLATNIAKNLGASGSYDSEFSTMASGDGFVDGVQTFLVVNSGAVTAIGTGVANTIWIKNTGKQLSTGAAHGGTATASDGTTLQTITVKAVAETIAVLAPGEGILLPGGADASNIKVNASGAELTLVERLVI